jgi:hypothetical protein
MLLLLDRIAAPDDLVERLQLGVQTLAGLPKGHDQLQFVEAHYASVCIWARRGKFGKAVGVIDAMLKGLGV